LARTSLRCFEGHGLSPCYADPDVWMKHMGDHYVHRSLCR
jgi:hypothetical protein